ncbi:MAG: AAA family ATPase [Cyanobacteria bacterium P01_F01_bin.150]
MSSSPSQLSRKQRLELVRLVNHLMQTDFESLVFALDAPRSVIPSATAAPGDRSTALLQWVEAPGGCGMDAFLSVLGEIVPLSVGLKTSAQEIKARELKTGSPYKGLEAFQGNNKSNFFGRTRWIQTLVGLLNQHNCLLLHGPSGSGKSSLIRAGVIPRLEEDAIFQGLVTLVFTPGKNPFKRWSRKLEQLVDEDKAEEFDQDDPEMLWKAVQDLKDDRPWLIFIDQFEELFTQTLGKQRRDRFVDALIKLLDECQEAELSSVKLVMTMRSDFLGRLSDYPQFLRRIEATTKQLTKMEPAELETAVVQPAANHGVVFEPKLVKKIKDDFFEEAGSLPLLQYMLNVLWNPETIADRELTLEEYEAIGGLQSALNQQASKVWKEKFNDEQQQAAQQLFVQLVDVDENEPVRRPVTRAELKVEQNPVLAETLDILTSEKVRLLVADEETVEVAHEELLRSWDVLTQLVETHRENLTLRQRLTTDANEWKRLQEQGDTDQAKAELWEGSKLARVLELRRAKFLKEGDATIDEFVAACVAQEEEDLQAERERNAQLKRALTRAEVQVQTNQALSLMQGQTVDGLEIALAATERNLQELPKQMLSAVQSSLHNFVEQRQVGTPCKGHESYVNSVAFSPDGAHIVSGSWDSSVCIWDLEGHLLAHCKGHEDSVYSVAFSSDGAHIVSGSEDNSVRIWRGGWKAWLKVCWNRYAYHAIGTNPTVDLGERFPHCIRTAWSHTDYARALLRQAGDLIRLYDRQQNYGWEYDKLLIGQKLEQADAEIKKVGASHSSSDSVEDPAELQKVVKRYQSIAEAYQAL